jgi:hypothetical protein
MNLAFTQFKYLFPIFGFMATLLLPSVTHSQNMNADEQVFSNLDDKRVVAYLTSRDSSEAAEAVNEIMKRGERMIPLLANNKGDGRPFCGITKLGEWSSGTVVTFDKSEPCKNSTGTTVEVASIFLICAIYYDDIEFASPPLLCDYPSPSMDGSCGPVGNNQERINKAWASVEKWIDEFQREGIDSLRSKEKSPLSGSKVSFY